jgi:hypothetical protein
MGPRSKELFVVETYDGPAYIGQMRRANTFVVLYNGFVGRPRTVPMSDVARIVRADKHPDVVKVWRRPTKRVSWGG